MKQTPTPRWKTPDTRTRTKKRDSNKTLITTNDLQIKEILEQHTLHTH